MTNIQAKDGTGATIYLYSTKDNDSVEPAVSQENLLDELISLKALLPATLGQKETAGSLSVTVASNQSAVPVSGPSNVALATDSVSQAIRDRLPSALVANAGRLNVETLGVPGTSRQLTAGSSSANVALSANVYRISIYARNADIRYAIGSGAQSAGGSSHFIAAGERLDLALPATSPNIAVIRAGGSTDGILEITELS